ncbi:TniQ family protein [Halalkalibacter okhensis]|uniref:TniQ domain-containing protein n=1 Tax=Halalkalibacter okhensis TaxID=333138 RepID=A0A0B0IJX5_9BACI|nr:TniQ family protein [Halalkalibacter okhensis]KHF41197.1 hypothetical protein LQ50_05410 [Halalkalibacter okhensis]
MCNNVGLKRVEGNNAPNTNNMERSRLYNIMPEGLDTYQVESLHSYLLRLAEKHVVPVWILLEKEVAYLFSKEFLKEYIKKRQTNHVHYINSCTEITEDYLNALEIVTTRELSKLTLLNGRGLFSIKRNMIRKNRAWCPLCFESWKEEGKEIYEPLIWNIELMKYCPDHFVPLDDKCYSCGKKNKFISSSQQVGHCGKCGNWLGKENVEEYKELDEWDLWCISNFKQILEFLQQSNNIPLRHFPNQIVKMLVNQYTDGNVSEFSRILNVSMISEYVMDRSNITFEKLLNLSFYFQTSIVDLIHFKPIDKSNINLSAIDNLENRQHSYYNVTPEEVRKELQTILDSEQIPPLSMAQVIKLSKYSTYILYKHAKDLCEEITSKRKAHFLRQKEIKLNQIKYDVIPIVEKLLEEGIYPSEAIVEQRIPYTVFKKELKILIDEIMEELQ